MWIRLLFCEDINSEHLSFIPFYLSQDFGVNRFSCCTMVSHFTSHSSSSRGYFVTLERHSQAAFSVWSDLYRPLPTHPHGPALVRPPYTVVKSPDVSLTRIDVP